MIGVIVDQQDSAVAEEFFELFKTPWESYRPGGGYRVVVATRPAASLPEADLTVVYGFDANDTFDSGDEGPGNGPVLVRYRDKRFPIYGGCANIQGPGLSLISRDGSAQLVGLETSGPNGKTVRIGYDLLWEVRYLLSQGQPVEEAGVPTLDLHISVLRDLIVDLGVPLAEIPPVPAGYWWTLCLTHDVDFVAIRRHRLDRTVLGFLYRATVVSLLRFVKGRLCLGKLLRNLLAVLSLPLVHLGVTRDFFNQFQRYLELEGTRKSTFFLIPRKDIDGAGSEGRDPKGRAVRYDIEDIGADIAGVLAKGCEVGLHGLDAWHDQTRAAEERGRIRQGTGNNPTGVRIHWLFWSHQTPRVLELAGFTYDSTCGYNDTVGFRAGTTQVFRPLGAERLLELPLHVQDTALFARGRMNLSQEQGSRIIEELVANTRRVGGVLTVNWHMRSLGPERLWEDPYRHLLRLAEADEVWCAQANEVVAWFAWRRSALFSEVDMEAGRLRVTVGQNRSLPPLSLRLYNMPPDGAQESRVMSFAGNLELMDGRREQHSSYG